MSEILEKEYYKKNPQYSEVECVHCKKKKLRIIGIECFEEYGKEEKTFHRCEECGQEAYIEIEWIFTIKLPTTIKLHKE